MRGLDALCALNARDGATVADVVHDIRLPRTTVYRVLETLGEAGYLYRDPRDDRYRLTRFVRALSDGFDEDAWIARIALPRVGALSRSLGWPVAIATPSGARMLLRESADRRAALRVPLATSAAGLAYLAYTPSAQREALVGALGRGAPSPQRAPADFDRLLDDVRAQGFASSPAAASPAPSADETDLSVAVSVGDRALAAVNVRFGARSVAAASAAGLFLAKLRVCAQEIRDEFVQELK